MDRPPNPGWEEATFTAQPATQFDEHWVAIDVPTARSAYNHLLDGFLATRGLPLIP